MSLLFGRQLLHHLDVGGHVPQLLVHLACFEIVPKDMQADRGCAQFPLDTDFLLFSSQEPISVKEVMKWKPPPCLPAHPSRFDSGRARSRFRDGQRI